ncbi:MAG TPA: hypothetical protein VHN99_08615 [Deinococcales bacterium]|nr:hypothetical protein [Deinococcales bacterium]
MKPAARTLAAAILALAALAGAALATPRLGAALPEGLGLPKAGSPALVVFYTRSCQEPEAWAKLWVALAAARLPVAAVNVPENDQAPLPVPETAKLPALLRQDGPAALTASRAAGTRQYPTILVVDASRRIRAALEGWEALPGLPAALNDLP